MTNNAVFAVGWGGKVTAGSVLEYTPHNEGVGGSGGMLLHLFYRYEIGVGGQLRFQAKPIYLAEETAFPIGEQDNLETVVKTKISVRWEWISEFPLVQAERYSGNIKCRK
jgi:hypothetical protein